MRLGTRWPAGDEPPSSVPEAVRSALADVERQRGSSLEPSSWTLTWLEGRPVVTLDDGTTVTLRDDVVLVRDGAEADADSDDW